MHYFHPFVQKSSVVPRKSMYESPSRIPRRVSSQARKRVTKRKRGISRLRFPFHRSPRCWDWKNLFFRKEREDLHTGYTHEGLDIFVAYVRWNISYLGDIRVDVFTLLRKGTWLSLMSTWHKGHLNTEREWRKQTLERVGLSRLFSTFLKQNTSIILEKTRGWISYFFGLYNLKYHQASSNYLPSSFLTSIESLSHPPPYELARVISSIKVIQDQASWSKVWYLNIEASSIENRVFECSTPPHSIYVGTHGFPVHSPAGKQILCIPLFYTFSAHWDKPQYLKNRGIVAI